MPFDVNYYLYKMNQFYWLLCEAKNFLSFGRISSPPVGLVQWLSDITSSPHCGRGVQCHRKGSPTKRRVHQNANVAEGSNLASTNQDKKYKRPQKAPKRTIRKQGYSRSRPIKATKRKEITQNKVTCAVDQLRTPSARKPQKHKQGNPRSRPRE